MEVQEGIGVDFRLYEKEARNTGVKKLRTRKEGMDQLKGRLRQVAPQLGVIAERWGFQQDESFESSFTSSTWSHHGKFV